LKDRGPGGMPGHPGLDPCRTYVVRKHGEWYGMWCCMKKHLLCVVLSIKNRGYVCVCGVANTWRKVTGK